MEKQTPLEHYKRYNQEILELDDKQLEIDVFGRESTNISKRISYRARRMDKLAEASEDVRQYKHAERVRLHSKLLETPKTLRLFESFGTRSSRARPAKPRYQCQRGAS